MRMSAAAISVVVAAVPIAAPPPLPPLGHTPRSGESTSSGRRVRKTLFPPAVGSVALELASRVPQADASHVYACSIDEYNNQHCALLYTDIDMSWSSFIILGLCAVVIIALILKYCVDKNLRHWFDGRAMLVVSDADDGDASPTAPLVGFRRSDSSDDPGCYVTTCDMSTQVNYCQMYSNQELGNDM